MKTNCQIKSKGILFISLLNLLCAIKANAQYDSLLKIKAMLIVEADFSNYNVVNNQKLLLFDDVRKGYSIDSLKSEGIYDCYFFKITPNAHIKNCPCSYYLAYSINTKEFYKLSGFKNSEFAEFYNEVLLGGSVSFPKKMRNNKQRKAFILMNAYIESIDLGDYYRRYYKNYLTCSVDTSSCYRKTLIIAY
jgi:hypothetical protein